MANFSKYLFIAFCILFSLESCRSVEVPISTQRASNNNTYKISFLFEHDGCKVYRFEDGGQLIYFTSCNGETTKLQTDSTGTRHYKSINKNN
jgi:Domain of unknown function (DUF4884)